MLRARPLRFDTAAARLRSAALLEGVSYLVLLFIAMPLKYLWHRPLAVRIAGSLHGLLFIALAIAVLRALRSRGKSRHWAARVAVAALIPFGTFWLDRELRADDEAYRSQVRTAGLR